MAPGPGHRQIDRSLAVKLDPAAPDGFVVFSHAGDDAIACRDHVREKCGLAPFKPNGKTNGLAVVAASYPYFDENGDTLFVVDRYDPKGFRQRRPDGKGGWQFSLDDVRKVPYRLPEVIEAVASERPIFVAEGEKAVHALEQIGVTGTCSPGGAGKWRKEYSDHLKDADVIVLPDADVPGEQHARSVAASLAGIAKKVRVLRLPNLADKGDPFDWIRAGGTADGLWALLETVDAEGSEPNATGATAGWQSHVFTAAALRTMAFPPVSYVVPGIIPEGLTILAGRPKIGKSWMALDLAIGIATGEPVLGGVHVEQGDVLYCCLEDNPRRLQRRVTKLLSPFGDEWPERLTLATRWRRLDEGGVEDIEAWC